MAVNIYSIAYISKAKERIIKGVNKDDIINEIASELMRNGIDEDMAILAAKLAYARAIVNIYAEHNKIDEESNTSDREHEGSSKHIKPNKGA
jgi:hypothetical protein